MKYWKDQSCERETLGSYHGPGADRVGRGEAVEGRGVGIFLDLHYENREYFLLFGNNSLKIPGLPWWYSR